MIGGEDSGVDGDLPVEPAGPLRGAAPRPRRADRRRARPPARRGGRRRSRRAARSSSAASWTPTRASTCPGVPLPIPSLTEKDLRDLEFALEPRRRLRRALVRPLGRGRARSCASCSHAAGSHGSGDREDREGGGARRPRRRSSSASDAVMVARGDLGVEIGPADGAARPEADHLLSALEHGKPGDHGDADARVDAAPARADARRGERRRQRDPRRDVRGHALGRDGGRPVPGRERSRRWTGSRARSSRASPTGTSSPAPDEPFRRVGEAMSNAACDIAEVLDAAGDPRPDVQRPHGVRRRSPPAAAAGHRRHAQAATPRSSSRSSGGSCPAEIEECRDVEDLWARTARGGARDRARRAGRPRRHHGRDGRQRPGHDEPDQGGDRLANSEGKPARARRKLGSSRLGR